MIKGLLKSVFILGLILLPVSFSNAKNFNYYSPFSINSRCSYYVDYDISNNGNLKTYYNGLTKNNLLYFIGSTRVNCNDASAIVIGRKNGRLYWFANQSLNNNNSYFQGYLNSYGLCDDNSCNLVLPFSAVKSVLENNKILGLRISNSASDDSTTPPVDNSHSNYWGFCFIVESATTPYVCFYSGRPSNPSGAGGVTQGIIGESLGFSVRDWYDISSWDGFFDSTPLNSSFSDNSSYTPGNNEVIPTDIDRYIEYYEGRYGRNSNLCYVGTNDYTTNYGSGNISFEAGTGLTLNELYYNLYGTFGSNNIKNVGTFINVWLMNYEQWFYKGKGWIANYNGPDTNVTYNYQDIDYPFLNKPVAIYFMSNNLYDYYRVRDNQGEEMAYYCQLKVNYTYFKENPDRFKEEEDKVDPVYTDRAKIYYNNMVNNNGSGKVGFQVPNLTGTLWGEVSSGNVLPEDLNPTNLFKDFFTKVTNLTETYSPAQNGILPDWIVYPLIFLVLFRIFRH